MVRKPEYHGRLGSGQTGEPGSHVTMFESIDPKTGMAHTLGGNEGSKHIHDPKQYDYFRPPTAAVHRDAAAPGAIKQPAPDWSGVKLPPSAAVSSGNLTPDQLAKAQALAGKYPAALVNAYAPGLIGPDGKVNPDVLQQQARDHPDMAQKYLGVTPAADPVSVPPPASNLQPAARITVNPLVDPQADTPARTDTTSQNFSAAPPASRTDLGGDGDPSGPRNSFTESQNMSVSE